MEIIVKRLTKVQAVSVLILVAVTLWYISYSLQVFRNFTEDPSLRDFYNGTTSLVNEGYSKEPELFKYQGRAQDDPELIDYIRSMLRPPSVKPYRLAGPNRKHFTAMEQSKFVGDLYGPGRRDGFFVEVGGLDGETSSSTLYLERELGFSGLLIEANPVNYKKLISKERKCFTINTALSPTPYSGELLFSGSHAQGKLTDVESKSTIKVKAFPLYSILQAMNVTFIDVFNLDIEGTEFKVLKTIPWDKVRLGFMIFEHYFIPEPQEVVEFMAKQGYEKIHENHMDYIFADPKYLQKLEEEKQE